VDELFKAGTGYLGWTPEVVLNTPICQLMLAIDGRFEFANKTNPFGGGGSTGAPKNLDEAAIKKRRLALEIITAKAKDAAKRKKECQRQPNAC
jgi:hypothetical protein